MCLQNNRFYYIITSTIINIKYLSEGGFVNKQVMYYDGVAIVKDENGNERKIQNCDNLDDILVEENVIETIQNQINVLEYNSLLFSKYRLGDMLSIPMPTLITILVPSIMMHITSSLNRSIIDGMIYTKFGLVEKDKFLSVFIAAFLPYALSQSNKWYNEYVEDKKCEMGRKITIQELKSGLLNSKEILEEMRRKSIPSTTIQTSHIIDDKERLEILREHVSFYYEIGYNFKEYYRYYIKYGDLPEAIKEEYNSTAIDIAKRILESNKGFTKKYNR